MTPEEYDIQYKLDNQVITNEHRGWNVELPSTMAGCASQRKQWAKLTMILVSIEHRDERNWEGSLVGGHVGEKPVPYYTVEVTANKAFTSGSLKYKKNSLAGTRYVIKHIILDKAITTTEAAEKVKDAPFANERRIHQGQREAYSWASEHGLSVSVDGSWVWIAGDTLPLKDDIKKLGCQWSGKRQAWYYREAA